MKGRLKNTGSNKQETHRSLFATMVESARSVAGTESEYFLTIKQSTIIHPSLYNLIILQPTTNLTN